MIDLEECEDGVLYRVYARNFWLGVFRKATSGFLGVRHKFGQVYLFEEHHWDAPAFPTARPMERLEVCPLRPLDEGNAELFAWLEARCAAYPAAPEWAWPGPGVSL